MVVEYFVAILRALEEARVRYLVVGGVAVVAHGYVRATKDIDLVLQLEPENLQRAIGALVELGYQPTVPVPFESFASAEERRRWQEEKHAVVFQLYHQRDPLMRIDLFLEEPFDFDAVYERAFVDDAATGVPARFLGLEDLIRMKLDSGRPIDLVDVEKLRRLQSEIEIERRLASKAENRASEEE